jgi:hypothetical protein
MRYPENRNLHERKRGDNVYGQVSGPCRKRQTEVEARRCPQFMVQFGFRRQFDRVTIFADDSSNKSRLNMINHLIAILTLLTLATGLHAESFKPITLHPENPHYFLFRGKPAILIGSTEHYGAVLNADFDYVRYLDEAKASGLNLTRTFSGMYREVPGSFAIVENTLGPDAKHYVCPWARTSTPGAADGGNKFDLKQWNKDYFTRLKDFVGQAGKRGIVVEFTLFCTIYDDKLWAVNPMNPANNVNDIGQVTRLQVYNLQDKGLTALQDSYVRKMAAELKGFDNVYFEICNEPYFGGVSKEWTDHVVQTIVEAESSLPSKHLIAENVANGSTRIEKPNPHVSIFNYHYSIPPESVALNYGLKKVIGDDETGFRGQKDHPYRTEGWDFFLAGGAVYDNLDYSFSVSHPDGTAAVTTSPGGGGRALRKQLRILKEFMEGFDYLEMKPDNSVIRGGTIIAPLSGYPPEAKATVRALVSPGKAYAIYVNGGKSAELVLELPQGEYEAEWVNTKTGEVAQNEKLNHTGGTKSLMSPGYDEDIALRVKKSTEKK